MFSRKSASLVYAILAGVSAFLIAMAAFAEEATRSGADAHHARTAQGNHGDSHRPSTWKVRCDKGTSLASALRRARPGDTLKISGTCVESVVVSTDKLRLTGVAGTTIDGSGAPSEGVIIIDGARGVTVENLTVQGGADQGVIATHQAQATLKRMTIRDNGTVGLSLDRSHLDLEDIALVNNGTGGMDAFTSSTAVLKGQIHATGNGGDGLVANGKSFLELRGATIVASGNLGSGVAAINDSRIQIFSFPEAQGSSITAESNGFAGVALLGAELGVVGSQFFGSGANVISSSNNALGFLVVAGAILSPHGTAKFVASGNALGMVAEDGASAFIIGGLNLTNNFVAGLAADGAGTLNFSTTNSNPAAVTNNGIDMDLSFGTRLTVNGVAVDSVRCDVTVLVRGIECPPPDPAD